MTQGPGFSPLTEASVYNGSRTWTLEVEIQTRFESFEPGPPYLNKAGSPREMAQWVRSLAAQAGRPKFKSPAPTLAFLRGQ